MPRQSAPKPLSKLEVWQPLQENGIYVWPNMHVEIMICQDGQVAFNTTHQLQVQFKSMFNPMKQ